MAGVIRMSARWSAAMPSIIREVSDSRSHSLLVAQPVLLFGKRALPDLQALHWGVNAIGFVLGNVVIGSAYDHLGSYGRAFQITFATTAALAAQTRIAQPRRS